MIESAVAANAGWSLEPGSVQLTIALGFGAKEKAVLERAIADLIAGAFR